MNKEFEKGQIYERIRQSSYQKLFLGYGCLLFSILYFFIPSLQKDSINTWVSVFLFILGLICLFIGYDEKKKLRLLK